MAPVGDYHGCSHVCASGVQIYGKKRVVLREVCVTYSERSNPCPRWLRIPTVTEHIFDTLNHAVLFLDCFFSFRFVHNYKQKLTIIFLHFDEDNDNITNVT